MRVFDMIVDERRRLAGLLATLTEQQFRQPSLCAGWTVHDVAAHLTTFLRFGQAKLYVGIVATAADFDRLNLLLTRWAARKPSRDIADLLRRRSDSRVTIPRSGYDPVLTDLILHDLDIRVPLGISRAIPADRMRVALNHLATVPSPGFAIGSRLVGLRLEATDTGWTHGTGLPVRGRAEALLMGMGGRGVAFDELAGDGVALLRERITIPPPQISPVRRLAVPVRVLLRPPPPERRSRAARA